MSDKACIVHALHPGELLYEARLVLLEAQLHGKLYAAGAHYLALEPGAGKLLGHLAYGVCRGLAVVDYKEVALSATLAP